MSFQPVHIVDKMSQSRKYTYAQRTYLNDAISAQSAHLRCLKRTPAVTARIDVRCSTRFFPQSTTSRILLIHLFFSHLVPTNASPCIYSLDGPFCCRMSRTHSNLTSIARLPRKALISGVTSAVPQPPLASLSGTRNPRVRG